MISDLACSVIELLSDTTTPVSAYASLCGGAADSVLLESAETGGAAGRYSVVAYDPLLSLTLLESELLRIADGSESRHSRSEFFEVLEQSLSDLSAIQTPGLPFVGSLIGSIGYDVVRMIEDLPERPGGDQYPTKLVLPSRYAVFDHVDRRLHLVALGKSGQAGSRALVEMRDRLGSAAPPPCEPPANLEIQLPPRARFLGAVARAKEYIADGEIFQVVISDDFTGSADIDPLSVYRRLRADSPSPYMFFLDFGHSQLLGSSPETMLKVHGRNAVIRPIAGTRGRSANPAEDRKLELDLKADAKERAEHVMLVDLARNDLGRVCEPGTVNVNELMEVERFSHVMHLTSNVTGRLRRDAGPVDAFVAAFPAGTVSGAPKVRAMEIIDQLESSARGPYAGAVGYFAPRMLDTCIAIRMILFRGNEFTVRAGAGIVADSEPRAEYREIEHKAAQCLCALESTLGGAE